MVPSGGSASPQFLIRILFAFGVMLFKIYGRALVRGNRD
jgi:hypothetical protein